ncbi:uncharacterized protein EMH_0097060 [Eimeria mitis]|uniref:Uncharacterized protein n=1 Tax=Eimeria mitis TaxID=44415 RepID=U6KF26_9EIME|nr:uncharacterized protein EMH_0097060 [Eimeria mitis]CDJ35376.1 hypothetical protein EMH_0097060 [Eimeria mitis]
MHWILNKTENVFKDVFYEPAIRAAASACDFAQPARELMQTLQGIRALQKRNSNSPKESLLPLLLTEKGRAALEAFIAAVDKQVLGSLCASWERSGVLQTQADPEQRQYEGAPPRVRQLSARNTGKDAGTPMALSSYADAAGRGDVHPKAAAAVVAPAATAAAVTAKMQLCTAIARRDVFWLDAASASGLLLLCFVVRQLQGRGTPQGFVERPAVLAGFRC